jgi:hypothetical protein
LKALKTGSKSVAPLMPGKKVGRDLSAVREGTQFKPGQAPPPGGGRPRTKPIKEAIQALFDNDPKALRAIAEMAVKKAKAGDGKFFSEIRDMFDGKPVTEISGPEGEPLTAPAVHVHFEETKKE